MDFTERLELYQEGGMLDENDVKNILAVIAMFREKYDFALCEENAAAFVAHLCAAFGRNHSHEPVEPLLEEAFAEVKELASYPLSLEMLADIHQIISEPLSQVEQEYVLLHLNTLIETMGKSES